MTEHYVFAAPTPKDSKVVCELCNKKAFFTITKNLNVHTCPLCCNDCINLNKDDHLFCDICLIIFDIGCEHAIQGSKDIYYASLVYSFTYENKLYENSMPLFDNFTDYFNNRSKYIFNFTCQCPGQCHDCPNVYYFHNNFTCSCKGIYIHSSDDDLFHSLVVSDNKIHKKSQFILR